MFLFPEWGSNPQPSRYSHTLGPLGHDDLTLIYLILFISSCGNRTHNLPPSQSYAFAPAQRPTLIGLVMCYKVRTYIRGTRM